MFFKKLFLALSKKEQLAVWLAAAIAAASFLGLIALFLSHRTTVKPASGGLYTEGIVGQPSFVNPVTAVTDVDRSLVRLLFSNINNLADTIETETGKNSASWKVRLKENTFWQDGKKLTSDDILFTIEKIKDPDSQSPQFADWQGVTAHRLSELEMQFDLSVPYVFFPDTLKQLYIIPKHLFADIPVSNWHLSQYNMQPIGSGPYQVEGIDRQSNGYINAYYLKTNTRFMGPHTYITNFRFLFFPNQNDVIQAFNSGRIDGFFDLEPGYQTALKRPYQHLDFVLPNYYSVFINQSKNLFLQDRSIRQALAWSANTSGLVQDVLSNNAWTQYGPIPEGAPGFKNISQDQKSSFTLENASRTLDAQGWKLNDRGIRARTVKKVSIPLQFTLTVPKIPFLLETAHYLQQQWKTAGISVAIDEREPADINEAVIKNRDYELLLFGNILGKNSDLFSFWHSSQRFYPGLNLSLYNNSIVDSLIEVARQNPDTQNRFSQLGHVQELIENDYPAVFLFTPQYSYITNTHIQGIESGFIDDPVERFDGISKWYLRTSRVFK